MPVVEKEELGLAEAVGVLLPGLPQGALPQPEDAPVDDEDDGYCADGKRSAPDCCQPAHQLERSASLAAP